MTTASVEAFSDARSREAARLDLGRNLIVEAGAGTGKTTLLVERMLFLLLGGLEGGARPIDCERLVALTFTERAAAEIKSRLALRLDRIAAGIQGGASAREDEGLLLELERSFARSKEQALDLALAALRGLGRAQIGTIHSFAARLLREHPIEAC
ncbi:MAG: UvrD-helicase domain-containing protein, partial [Elusimicrobiota bacterium]